MKRPSKDSQLHESKWITSQDFEYLCFNLAKEVLAYDEPIPDYQTRNNSLLESALGSPQHGVADKFLYPALPDQGAILFYTMIKNHPFFNGNKRIAVMTLLAFLFINNKWLEMEPAKLYEMAIEVSVSDRKNKEFMLKKLTMQIKHHLVENLGK